MRLIPSRRPRKRASTLSFSPRSPALFRGLAFRSVFAADLKKGPVYSMLDAAPDSFPINIDFIFKNQISSERIGSLCWTKFDEEADLVSVSGCKSNP